MKYLLTGASGLIGGALKRRLTAAGHEVVPLVRRAVKPGERAIAWNPEQGTIDRAALEGADVFAHFAGENVFGRWSDEKKRRIRDSRVLGTELVSRTIAGLARKPQVLLAASAIGYYGSRGAEELTEESSPGNDFLAQVVRDWERATAPARDAGVRVVNMRFGVVLAPGGKGGALATILPPFRMGLGGPVGNGKQYFSWIALDDVLAAILFLQEHTAISGPINVAAPHPVTNREFAKTLGHVLGRPAVVPVPSFALRLAFGSEAAEMLTTGQLVHPRRLLAAGFPFQYPDLEPALRHLLAAPAGGS